MESLPEDEAASASTRSTVGPKVTASGMTSKNPSERVRVALAGPSAVPLGIVRLRKLVDCTERFVALSDCGEAGGGPTNRLTVISCVTPTPFNFAELVDERLANEGCTRNGPGSGSCRDVRELISRKPTPWKAAPKSMLVSSIAKVVIDCPEKGST